MNSFVCQLESEMVRALAVRLEAKGWEFRDIPHAHWQARGEGAVVSVYKSGKLSAQGRGTKDFVEFLLEPEILRKVVTGYAREELAGGVAEPHIGVDESGKGDFFGPLVVAGVFVNESTSARLRSAGVKDSKIIKKDKRIFAVAAEIREIVGAAGFGVVPIGNEAYNRLYDKFGRNLNRLLAWGHARVIENVLATAGVCAYVLSDKFGDEKLIENALMDRGGGIELRQETKAESDVAVAAASILARAEFIRRLERCGDEMGVALPRGAGVKVDEVAAEIAVSRGAEALASVSKRHFRTFDKALARAASPV